MTAFALRCVRCGTERPFGLDPVCAACGLGPLEARYALAAGLADAWRTREATPSLWRYRDLLPLADDRHVVSLGEGDTPLIRADRLGRELGLSNLHVKDERQNPTGSFKDRQASVAISVLVEHGVHEVVVASTGNVALAYAAYAARAQVRLHAFLPRTAPADKIREIALYGAQTVLVDGTYDATKAVADRFASERGLPLDRGVRTVAAVEGMKTVAFEIARQLGWRSPDWYLQSVSGGMGPVGVAKGFGELVCLGLADKIPALGLVQVQGCAPMTEAFEAGLRLAPKVTEPATAIGTLATGDPGLAYEILFDAISRHGGRFTSVTDDEAWEATRTVARCEGLSVEPAAAVTFAGLFKLARSGAIAPDATVVVNASGHSYPVEPHIVEAARQVRADGLPSA